MNPLIEHQKASIREFLKKFDNKLELRFFGKDTGFLFPKEDGDPVVAIVAFLLRDRISFWESEVQRMGVMKVIIPECRGNRADDYRCTCAENRKELSDNAAIDAMLKPYIEAVKWGKEQLKK